MFEFIDTLLKDRPRRIATIVIVLMMVGTLIAGLNPGRWAQQAAAQPDDSQYPYLECDGGCNVPVTTGARDNNEPSVAVNPLDPMNVVAASNDYNIPSGDAWVGFYSSMDGGKTWARDFIPGYPGGPVSPLTGFRGSGDPVLTFDSHGNCYLAGIAFKRAVNPLNPLGFGLNAGKANGIFVAKSTNGGKSFDQVTLVWAALQSIANFHDKEWVAVDPNNGNVYVAWADFTALSTARVLFSRSTDGGATFSRPIIVTEAPGENNIQGTSLQVDDNGGVHLFWMNFADSVIRYAMSTDGGASFSSPTDIAPFQEIPRQMDGQNYRTPTLTMSAIDVWEDSPYKGSLYVTWNDYATGDSDILMVYSHDYGQTWSEPVRVNNDNETSGTDQFFPAVATSPDGKVHFIFYDRRNDENNTMLEVYYAQSDDGGANFTSQLNMTDTSFDGDWSRAGDNDFIGDYLGVAASPTTAYGVWCDTREGEGDTGPSQIYVGRMVFASREEEDAT